MSEKSGTKNKMVRTVVIKTPIEQTSELDVSLPVYCEMCDSELCNYSSWRTHKSKFHRNDKININRSELKTVVSRSENNNNNDDDDDVTTESEDEAIQMIDAFLGKPPQKQTPPLQISSVESRSPVDPKQEVEPEVVISKAELAKHHIAMACSILLEPFTKINDGKLIHESETTHEFIADQIVYAALTELLAARGQDIVEITSEVEIENSYGLLAVLNEINNKRRFYDSEVRWKKMQIIEDKLLKRIGQFYAKRHLGLANHKVKFSEVEQEKSVQSSSSEADTSQKSKKQKHQ